MTLLDRCPGLLGAGLLCALLAGCAGTPSRAPVEDRPVAGRTPAPVSSSTTPTAAPAAPSAAAPAAAPGSEAPRPGTHVIKPGDTLIRIGLDHGQPWRDIARWNNITNPDRIEVGQVLTVVPPGSEQAQARPVVPPGRTAPGATVPAVPAAASTATAASPAASSPAAAVPATPPAAVPPSPAPAPANSDEDVPWMWPASGAVASAFEEGKTKGLAITGKAGDPVLAAADGRVVYAGSGLRGYGNLIIVKHNNTFLTAYAHNQALLVKEDQAVRRGQRIAEMGSSDSDRVQLHFEIRRQGKPIDPARLLPAR
jgi:lipoprotein NlpD